MRLLLAVLFWTLNPLVAEAARAKDIGAFFGVRDVQLTGFGLVTGLQQTGDTQINKATVQNLVERLRAQGVMVAQADLMSRNVALVSVTANVRSDVRIGSRFDVQVSSAGDARSLEGGVLQPALLFSIGELDAVYAVAQGPLSIGGFNVEEDGAQSRKNVTNVGSVPGGAILEREIAPMADWANLTEVDFLLDEDHRDFTTAMRLADAVNAAFGKDIADPQSAATVRIQIPDELRGKFARFAAQVEQVLVDPDVVSRVVIDARTGTVVMGGTVTVRPFAIAHGGLKIEVQDVRTASQPGPLSRTGETVVVENTFVGVNEEKGQLILVNAVSLADLVGALNTMGVAPRDLVVILMAIRDAGALDAEVVTR